MSAERCKHCGSKYDKYDNCDCPIKFPRKKVVRCMKCSKKILSCAKYVLCLNCKVNFQKTYMYEAEVFNG